jgi:hypothetical protein
MPGEKSTAVTRTDGSNSAMAMAAFPVPQEINIRQNRVDITS